MREQSKAVYRFGPFQVDSAERVLLCNGEPVSLTPKAFETLHVLVKNSGRVLEKDELMELIWPDSFVEEATLAQNIFTLRRILGESPHEHHYIETVPRRGYRFVAKVVKVWDAGVEQMARKEAEADPAVKSIAVLPFRYFNQSIGDEYFGLGMADALITKLSNIKKIIVRPTSAIIRYNNLDQEPIAGGKQLKVDLVLEGKIQRFGDRVRVTVQLLDVENEAPLWAEKFDDVFVDIFAVQDAISEQVVEALTLKLTRDEKRLLSKHHTKNSEAYQEHLKGRYQWNKWTEEGFRKSIQHYQRAIEMEPSYALAFSGIADAYNALAFYSYVSPHEGMPQVKINARIALNLDDTLAEAHLSLATALMFYDWDWQASEREFKQAIKLNPSYAIAHQGYGLYLIAMGRFQEAQMELKTAVELDPVSPLIVTTMGFPFYFAGRYDRAIELYEQALEVEPNFGLTYASLGDALTEKGKFEQAIEKYQKGIALLGRKENLLASLGYAFAKLGDRRAAIEVLNEMKDQSTKRYISPLALATVYIGLDEKEQTFEQLQKAYEMRGTRLVFLKVIPTFRSLRSDERFTDLLTRMRLA